MNSDLDRMKFVLLNRVLVYVFKTTGSELQAKGASTTTEFILSGNLGNRRCRKKSGSQNDLFEPLLAMKMICRLHQIG